MDIFKQSLEEHLSVMQHIVPLAEQVNIVCGCVIEAVSHGGKVIVFGNGGSAADAQHIAAELVGRFKRQRKGIPAIACNTDTSIMTSVANDYGYEAVFARQVEALARAGDVVIGISTSGNSPNVVAAIKKAAELGCITIGLLGGSGGTLKTLVDYALVVPSNDTPRIQECHGFIAHVMCDIIESAFEKA